MPGPVGRIALVIGNSSYRAEAKLTNPRNDARAIAAALTRIGFTSATEKKVSVKAHLDLTGADLRRQLASFARLAEEASQAVIYYAGHGIEIAGQNYLVPVDARLLHPTDVEFETTSLMQVLTAIQGRSGLRLVIVDACRTNPFAARLFPKRALSSGLRGIEPPGSTLVAYAAKHGTVALDGRGNNSPYAESILTYIERDGVEIIDMFREVRDDVLDKTHQQQEPFLYGSLGRCREYLVSPTRNKNDDAELTQHQDILPKQSIHRKKINIGPKFIFSLLVVIATLAIIPIRLNFSTLQKPSESVVSERGQISEDSITSGKPKNVVRDDSPIIITRWPEETVNKGADGKQADVRCDEEDVADGSTKLGPRLVEIGQSPPKGGGIPTIGNPNSLTGLPKQLVYKTSGAASWYGEMFHGRRTNNGEISDMDALLAAHPTLPLPSYAKITNFANARSIVVRINDRGPYIAGPVIHLSWASAYLLELTTDAPDPTRVCVEYLGPAPLDGNDNYERRFLAQQPWAGKKVAFAKSPAKALMANQR